MQITLLASFVPSSVSQKMETETSCCKPSFKKKKNLKALKSISSVTYKKNPERLAASRKSYVRTLS